MDRLDVMKWDFMKGEVMGSAFLAQKKNHLDGGI